MRIEGKVLVITGGGNGIGRELVLQALARGAPLHGLQNQLAPDAVAAAGDDQDFAFDAHRCSEPEPTLVRRQAFGAAKRMPSGPEAPSQGFQGFSKCAPKTKVVS